MRSLFLALAAGTLCLGAVSEAAVVLDLGTDPGQTNNTTAGFTIQGGFGVPHTRTWAADSVSLGYTMASAWQNSGEQYRGTLFSTINLTGVQAGDQLAIEARVIIGTPAPDYYLYTMIMYAADGSSSTYQFINSVRANPTPFSYGTDPGTVPFSVANATTLMGSPTSIASGGFDFATDTLSGIDLLAQVGTTGGSFTMEIDNIQINPVPEPSILGLLGASSALFLRRRRA